MKYAASLVAALGAAMAMAAAREPFMRNVSNLAALRSDGAGIRRLPLDRVALECQTVGLHTIPGAASDLSSRCALAALADLEPARTANPSDPVACAIAGDAYWSLRDVSAARTTWARAGDYDRLNKAAAYLQKHGDADAAEAVYAAAVSIRPSAQDAQLALAGLRWTRGHLDAAARTYESMIARYPREMGEVPYNALAMIYADRGDYVRAESVLNEGFRWSPRSIALRTTAGMVDAWAGRNARAVTRLTSVLRERPDDKEACYWLGWTYARSGDDPEAARQFATCLARHPGDARTRYDQGVVMVRLHNYAAARAMFQQVVSTSPGNVAARDRLREVEAALR